MIDKTDSRKVVSRIGDATAAYYTDSRRIVIIADKAAFADAAAALTELRDEVC